MGRITSPVIHWKMLPWWSRSENSHWFPSGLNNAWEAFTCVSTFFLSLSQSLSLLPLLIWIGEQSLISVWAQQCVACVCGQSEWKSTSCDFLPGLKTNTIYFHQVDSIFFETDRAICMFHCSCICFCTWKLHVEIPSCNNLDWNWHQF